MSLTSAIARNTAIQTGGKVISVLLGWVIILLMTNSLGAAGFGEYTIIVAYLQLFGITADFGMVLVSSQFFAEYPDDRQRLFANLFTFRLLTAAALLALAPLLIWLFPYSFLVKQGVLILAFSFFLSALIQIYTGFNQYRLTMGRVVGGEILSRLVLVAFLVLAIAKNYGLPFMLIRVVFGAAANFFWLIYFGRSSGRFAFALDWPLWKNIGQRAWPLMTTILLNLVYLKADTIILSLTRSAVEVGVYGAVYRVFEVLITFPTMFASLLVPILSAARLREDRETMQRLAERGYEIIIYAIVPLIVGTMLAASYVVALFGREFMQDGPPLLKLLVIANAMVFVGTYFAHLVVAANQQKKMIAPFAATATLALAGYLIFIPRFGAYGAASMTIFAEALIAIFAYIILRRFTPMAVILGRPVKIALVAILPMIALGVSGFLPMVMAAFIGFAIYVVLLIIMGALPHHAFDEMAGLDVERKI